MVVNLSQYPVQPFVFLLFFLKFLLEENILSPDIQTVHQAVPTPEIMVSSVSFSSAPMHLQYNFHLIIQASLSEILTLFRRFLYKLQHYHVELSLQFQRLLLFYPAHSLRFRNPNPQEPEENIWNRLKIKHFSIQSCPLTVMPLKVLCL